MFGELALITKKPRAATVLAKEDSEFAVLNEKDFRHILEVVHKKKLNAKIKLFSDNIL